MLPTCPGTEKDQILVPISGGYKAYSLLVLLGIDRRMLRSTANFGNAPMHFITQRGPFQDGETAIDMRWDTRVMQLMVSEALHNRWDFWERQCRVTMEPSRRLVVLTLDGWRESVGVTAEITYMSNAGKPVLYRDPDSGRITKKAGRE